MFVFSVLLLCYQMDSQKTVSIEEYNELNKKYNELQNQLKELQNNSAELLKQINKMLE